MFQRVQDQHMDKSRRLFRESSGGITDLQEGCEKTGQDSIKKTMSRNDRTCFLGGKWASQTTAVNNFSGLLQKTGAPKDQGDVGRLKSREQSSTLRSPDGITQETAVFQIAVSLIFHIWVPQGLELLTESQNP